MPDDRSNLMVMLNSTFRFEFHATPEPEHESLEQSAPADEEPPIALNFCKTTPVFPTHPIGLHAVEAEPTIALASGLPGDDVDQPSSDFSPLRVLQGTVMFNGDCGACRLYCGALCCKGYSIVHLSEAEAQSGRYAYAEVSSDCTCANCTLMRDLNLQYKLWKKEDGTCYFLTEDNYCSIHNDRPEACRMYTCKGTAFQIKP